MLYPFPGRLFDFIGYACNIFFGKLTATFDGMQEKSVKNTCQIIPFDQVPADAHHILIGLRRDGIRGLGLGLYGFDGLQLVSPFRRRQNIHPLYAYNTPFNRKSFNHKTAFTAKKRRTDFLPVSFCSIVPLPAYTYSGSQAIFSTFSNV